MIDSVGKEKYFIISKLLEYYETFTSFHFKKWILLC